jgi:hypothetical protein
VTHTGRRGDAVAHFVPYSCGLRVQVLVCARNRWGIRVGFCAMGDFEFPGLVVYSEGVGIAAVNVNCGAPGNVPSGHLIVWTWRARELVLCMRPFIIGTGVLLRYRGSIYWCVSHGAAACNGIGQSRVCGPWRVHESAGDSLLEKWGEGAGRSFISYGNLARDFALLSAVCWMFAGCDPTVTTTVVTLIKAVKVVVL